MVFVTKKVSITRTSAQIIIESETDPLVSRAAGFFGIRGCGGGNYDTFPSPSLSIIVKQHHSDTLVFATEKSVTMTYSLLQQLGYVNDEEYKHSTVLIIIVLLRKPDFPCSICLDVVEFHRARFSCQFRVTVPLPSPIIASTSIGNGLMAEAMTTKGL
jgi:hypothetical protein